MFVCRGFRGDISPVAENRSSPKFRMLQLDPLQKTRAEWTERQAWKIKTKLQTSPKDRLYPTHIDEKIAFFLVSFK